MLRSLVSLLCVFAAPAFGDDELLLLSVDRATLGALLRKPILKTEPVSETVKRTTLQGLAHLTGTVTALPVPSTTEVALQMVFDSHTAVATTATGDGKKAPGEGKSHPEIAYQFQSTLGTTNRTVKTVLLRENGVAVYGAATTSSHTAVESFGPLRTQAQGLLPWRRFEVTETATAHGTEHERRRLRRGDPDRLPIEGRGIFPGLRAAMAAPQVKQEFLSPKTTADAGKSVTEKLTGQFDTSVWDELLPYHFKYLEYVYGPFVTNGLLGGRFSMGSTLERIAIQGNRGDKPRALDADRVPGVTAPVFLRLDEEFLMDFLEKRLGGTMLSDVEAAEFTGRNVPENFTLRSDRQTVVFVLEDKRPLLLRFDENRIAVTFRLKEARTLGRQLGKVLVKRSFQLRRGPNGALLLEPRPVVVADADGQPIAGEVGRHLVKRFDAFAAGEAKNLSTTTLFEASVPMRVENVTATGGKLSLGLRLAERSAR